MSQERSSAVWTIWDGFWGITLALAVVAVFACDAKRDRLSRLSSKGSILDATGGRDELPQVPGVESASQEPKSHEPPLTAAEQPSSRSSDQNTEQPQEEAPLAAAMPDIPLPALVAERPPPKPEHNVDFLGVKSNATSAAYVVDCSGSMTGRRFARALGALAKSISELKSDQRVFVVFFSNGAVPLFRDSGTPEWATATPLKKYDIFAQLEKMQAFGGTNPEPAVRIAALLNPDVIYLLSDGVFAPLDPRTIDFLTHREQVIKVNTIAFEDPEGAHVLQQIADATGGEHTFVPADDRVDSVRIEYMAELLDDLVESLLGSDDETRQKIRERLVQMARRIDHGPQPGASEAEVGRAVALWKELCRQNWLPLIGARDLPGVIRALRGDKAGPRWAAAVVARKKHLPVSAELVEVLENCGDLATCDEAHAALVQLANSDFGPADATSDLERARAVIRWRKWLDCQEMIRALTSFSDAKLADAIEDSNATRRWAVLVVARKQNRKIPGPLFVALRDSDEDVRHEAVMALAGLTRVSDLGPSLPGELTRFIPDGLIDLLSDSDSAVVTQAADCLELIASKLKTPPANTGNTPVRRRVSPEVWKKWWSKEKEDRAEKSFAMAKQLYDQGRTDAAKGRFKSLIDAFPGTVTAEKAKRLMNEK